MGIGRWPFLNAASNTSGTNYQRANIRPMCVTGKYARLGFYLSDAGTFWVRFRYIGIFRLV